MTKDELLSKIVRITGCAYAEAAIEQVVDEYLDSLIADKPTLGCSLGLVDILDLLNKAHEELAKSEITQDEYSHISWDLCDAKKRISRPVSYTHLTLPTILRV